MYQMKSNERVKSQPLDQIEKLIFICDTCNAAHT